MKNLSPEGVQRQYAKRLAGIPNLLNSHETINIIDTDEPEPEYNEHEIHTTVAFMQKEIKGLTNHIDRLIVDLYAAKTRIDKLEQTQGEKP